MKTKDTFRYLSKICSEKDFVKPPSNTIFQFENEDYVSLNQMKKSKGILFSSCSETDSILFLIQTISKNIILHIQDSNSDLFIHFMQYRFSWIEKGAIQKIFICHSNEIHHIDDYLNYLTEHHQLSKIIYLGKLSKDTFIGLSHGLFIVPFSKL